MRTEVGLVNFFSEIFRGKMTEGEELPRDQRVIFWEVEV